MRGTRVVIVALAIACSSCDSEYASEAENLAEERSEQRLNDARDDLLGSSYVETRGTFDCTEDCSGHEAGFSWAQENEVTDPADCGGNSRSFREGCEAYAEELEALAAERE